MKITFTLKITYPEDIISVEKDFTSSNRKNCFKLAEKWMDNCIAICGKDYKGRQYLDAEISAPK